MRVLPLLILAMALGSSCGYALQTSRSKLLDDEGIHKIYIAPLTNSTYKPGVEILVYNALVKTIAAHKRVTIVTRIEDADAVLSGSVSSAGYSSYAGTSINQIGPAGVGPRGVTGNSIGGLTQLGIAPPGGGVVSLTTEYNANLGCSFELSRTPAALKALPGKPTSVWGSSFTQSKVFPAAYNLDIQGSASHLQNESEFDRALSDMAIAAMADLHESMLAMF